MWITVIFIACAQVVMVRGQVDPCGSSQPLVVYGYNGAFTSPNYPAEYTNDLDCRWLINGTRTQSETVRVDFTDLITESCCDDVRLFDGTGLNDSLLLTASGFQPPLPPSTFSTGPPMLTRFTTNGDVVHPGFRIRFNADPACRNTKGETLTTSSGTFTSPYHPEPYPNNEDCTWKLSSIQGMSVQLEFGSFSLAPAVSGSCVDDYVEIIDGTVSARYCGTTSPGNWTASSTNVTVIFHSDGTSPHTGFSVNFLNVPAPTTPAPTTPDPVGLCSLCLPDDQCCGTSDTTAYCCPASGTFSLCCPNSGLDTWGCCIGDVIEECLLTNPSDCTPADIMVP